MTILHNVRLGFFKNGGEEFYKRDKAQETPLNVNPQSDVYDGNHQQAHYKAQKRTIEEMTIALDEAKRI